MTVSPFDAMLGKRFGFPSCRECGHDFRLTLEEVRTLVASAPELFQARLSGVRQPRRKPAPTTWSPSGYVWHVADWLRIQALRVYGVHHDPDMAPDGWVTLDPDELDGLFQYDRLSTSSGLFALDQSVGLFLAATSDLDPERTFEHPSGTTWRVLDVLRMVAHEVPHHAFDVQRALASP